MRKMYVLSNSKESEYFEKEILSLFRDRYECEKIIDLETGKEYDQYAFSEDDYFKVKRYIMPAIR